MHNLLSKHVRFYSQTRLKKKQKWDERISIIEHGKVRKSRYGHFSLVASFSKFLVCETSARERCT